MALPSLALPENARRRPASRFPIPHVLTGLGWLFIGLAIATYAFTTPSGWRDSRLPWLVTAFLCSAASLGLVFGARWARFLISALALVGAALIGVLSLAAFYPFEPFWWIGASFILFCAWTLFFTIGLWADYQPRKESAA